MPLVLDPNAPNPVGPTVLQSPDGRVLVWQTPFGIQMRANFQQGGTWLRRRTNLALNPSFAWVDGLSTGGGATLVESAEWTAKGPTSCKIIPNGSLSESAVYAASAANDAGMTGGHTYKVSAAIRLAGAQTGVLHSAARRIVVGYIDGDGVYTYTHATSAAAPNQAGQMRLQVYATLPDDAVTGLVRLMNGSANSSEPVWWDAVLIEEVDAVGDPLSDPSDLLGDYFDGNTPSTGDWQYSWLGEQSHSASIADAAHAVHAVRFLRDGIPVRSGNDRIAVAAKANAFDHEVPLDSTVTYVAVPVDDDGNLGTPTEGVSIDTLDLDPEKQCWLKSTSNPARSMQIEVQGDPETPYQGRDTFSDVQGSPLQAGGVDVMVEQPRTFQFKTYTQAELDQLIALLEPADVLFAQFLTASGLKEMYCVRGSVNVAWFRGSHMPERLVTVELKPTGRPSPVGADLVIPGRSYADSRAAAPTYADRQTVFPEYKDTLDIPELTIGPA